MLDELELKCEQFKKTNNILKKATNSNLQPFSVRNRRTIEKEV